MYRLLLPTFIVLLVFIALAFATGYPGHAPCNDCGHNDLQLCKEDQEVDDVCIEGNSPGICQKCMVDGGSCMLVCKTSGRKKRSLEELANEQEQE